MCRFNLWMRLGSLLVSVNIECFYWQLWNTTITFNDAFETQIIHHQPVICSCLPMCMKCECICAVRRDLVSTRHCFRNCSTTSSPIALCQIEENFGLAYSRRLHLPPLGRMHSLQNFGGKVSTTETRTWILNVTEMLLFMQCVVTKVCQNHLD